MASLSIFRNVEGNMRRYTLIEIVMGLVIIIEFIGVIYVRHLIGH